MLAGFWLIPGSQIYHVQTMSVPAHFSTVTLSAQTAIKATGKKTYAATHATGYLTIYNASFLNQSLPSGFVMSSQNGIEVMTDTSVFIPANNPPSDGVASVHAHTLIAGSQGDIQAGALNAVYNSSLYIRNLESFTGGHDAYSKTLVTSLDRTRALNAAKLQVQEKQTAQKQPGLLTQPCSETDTLASSRVSARLQCVYATYTYKIPANAHLEYARLQGTNVLLTIKTVIQPS